MSLRSDIASNGLTPALQRDVFLQLCRALFSDASIIRNTDLKTYLWTSSATTSRILIEQAEKFKIDELQKRPAILVKYLGSKTFFPGMMSGKIRRSASSTTEYRSFLLDSKFQIRCVAGKAREALHIGSEILVRFSENARTIIDDYGFGALNIAGLGAAQQVQEYKPNWMCAIDIQTGANFESYLDVSTVPTRISSDYDIG